MTYLQLTETGPGATASLTAEQARTLARSGVVEVIPGPAAGLWTVRGVGKVGVVRVGDVEVWIRPKVPVARLLFLLGYARDPGFWRDEPVALAVDDDLVPALAGTLWRQMNRALAGGVLHGYRTVDDVSVVLRGRLRERDQLAHHLGQPLPLEIRHDEFTVDIPENQILATAAYRMLRVPGVAETDKQALRHLLSKLDAVRLLPAGSAIPPWTPTRLNARYHAALHVAELVLSATSVEAATGEMLANGLLIDMPALFEDFLTAAVRTSMEQRHGGAVAGQSPHKLDRAGAFTIWTDITWTRHGRVRAIIDAKYKTTTSIDDLYQMLAYCTALRVTHGHLVYVAGAKPARHGIRHADIEIHCHVLDVEQEPADLLAAVNQLVDAIAATAT